MGFIVLDSDTNCECVSICITFRIKSESNY